MRTKSWVHSQLLQRDIKPSHATDPFWYPPENIGKPEGFRGYQKRSVAWNGLTILLAATFNCKTDLSQIRLGH